MADKPGIIEKGREFLGPALKWALYGLLAIFVLIAVGSTLVRYGPSWPKTATSTPTAATPPAPTDLAAIKDVIRDAVAAGNKPLEDRLAKLEKEREEAQKAATQPRTDQPTGGYPLEPPPAGQADWNGQGHWQNRPSPSIDQPQIITVEGQKVQVFGLPEERHLTHNELFRHFVQNCRTLKVRVEEVTDPEILRKYKRPSDPYLYHFVCLPWTWQR